MRFQRYIIEGGQDAGRLEIINTSLEDAKAYTQKLMDKKGQDLYEVMPDFDKQYEIAQRQASLGHTKRKEMPVIEPADVTNLLKHLKNGDIDVNAPYAPETDQSNLFPEHLKGKKAKDWMEDGKPKHDGGDKKDDVVDAKMTTVKVVELKPIQKQIYFDKSIGNTVKNGVEASKKFIANSMLVASSDLHIIDGHHRWLSALLLDPQMKVKALVIDMPITQLLELSRAFGDAVGNRRNA